MTGKVYDGSAWQTPTTWKVYDGSTWQTISHAWVYDGAAWQEFISPCDQVTYVISTTTTLVSVGSCAGCPNSGQAGVSWTPKSTCTNAYMQWYISKNGGSYTQIGSAGGCDISDRYYSGYNESIYNVLSTCNADCDLSCTATTYRGKVELYASSDDTLCQTEIAAVSSTRYVCGCGDCGGA